ncbi:MAG: carotenoid oxygenase family protein [Deltaproteobacteria bacterium]|nr:carotenoid oxygenase family protein [Deltaproteobacteria bacterium]
MTNRRDLGRRELLRLASASGASYLFAHAFGGCVSEPVPELPQDPMGRWWLSDNYAPVLDEIEAFDLEVEGSLPPELTGTLVRNGSNPAASESLHWFTGDGMLHGVQLAAGRALSYRNRFIDTLALRNGMPDNLGANRANTSIRTHAGKLLALYEVAVPHEIDPVTLATRGEYDFGGALRRPMSAHPKIDAATGQMFFIGYAPFAPFLTYHVVDATGALVSSLEVDIDHSSMMHDFQITERWAVIFDLPIHFDTAQLAAGFPFRWAPEAGARIGLLRRDGSDPTVRWFEIDLCFMFHSFNAYETSDGKVVVEGCRLNSLWETSISDASGTPRPWRWTLDPETGTSSESQLFERSVDFPQIDLRKVGREHRVAYSLGFDPMSTAVIAQPLSITKHDRASGATTEWLAPAGHQPDEALFVPFGDAEDDGYLVSMVFDASRARSYLAVLDATRVEAGPIAKVWMPRRVPFGFHGTWITS